MAKYSLNSLLFILSSRFYHVIFGMQIHFDAKSGKYISLKDIAALCARGSFYCYS